MILFILYYISETINYAFFLTKLSGGVVALIVFLIDVARDFCSLSRGLKVLHNDELKHKKLAAFRPV